MEVSMIGSPVPVPGISQKSGEKRSSWRTYWWGWGQVSMLCRPSLPPCACAGEPREP